MIPEAMKVVWSLFVENFLRRQQLYCADRRRCVDAELQRQRAPRNLHLGVYVNCGRNLNDFDGPEPHKPEVILAPWCQLST